MKTLVVGHHDYLGTGTLLVIDDRVFCIDTGCCRGRALTGLLLPDFQLYSVPARANHWERPHAQYACCTPPAAGTDGA